MKRRQLLTTVGSGAAVGSLAACNESGAESSGAPNVQTKKRIRWRLASSYKRTLDTIFGASEVMANRVSELTDGMFEIRVFPEGEVVPGTQVMDAVQQGSVDMGHTAGYYYTGKAPVLAFETAIPFGLQARQQLAWLNQGGGLDLINETLADFNILSMVGGSTGLQMGGWFRKEINSLEDLKGLKMRIPGIGGQIMSQLGVGVQVLSSAEIYPALERGALDATEFVGPYDDQKLGFYQVANHYYYPGWWEPGATLSFYLNRSSWEELPASFQAALQCACQEASLGMLNAYDAKNPAALKELLAKGVQMHEFSADIMEASYEATQDYLATQAGSDPVFKKVYDQWTDYKKASEDWFGTAEQSYANFAFGKAS